MASFEEQLAELEQVVGKLESGGLSLDESVKLFEDGVRLSNACKTQLSAAESRIQVLLEPKERGAARVEELEVDVEEVDDDADAGDADAGIDSGSGEE